MLFQLFGNRALVEIFVRFPICSAEQPARVLKDFAEAWRIFRTSPEAVEGRRDSEKKDAGEVRLSRQIYALQQQQKRGKEIADWINEEWNNWYKLKKDDQILWTEYTQGNISAKITELHQKQKPRFPCSAETIATNLHFQP